MKFVSILNTLSRYTIRRQFYIVYFPVIFLLTLVIGFFAITDSNQKLTESYKNLSALNAQRVKSIVFDTTSMVNKNAEFFSKDTELRSILSTTYTSPNDIYQRLTAYQSFKQISIQETAIQSLKVYTTNETIPDSDRIIFADQDILDADWFQQALITPDAFWVIDESVKPKKERINHYLTLYKNLPLPLSKYQAVLEIKIDYNFLKNRLITNNYDVQLQLNDGNMFYSDYYNEVGTPVTYDIPNKESFYQEEKFYGSSLVATNTLTLDNKTDKIYIYSIDNSSSTILQSNLYKWTSILVLSLVTTTVVIIIFANFFSKRIQELKKAVHHASIEDYAYLISDGGKDEISDILNDFHTVIQNIIAKDQAVLNSKLAEQEFKNEQQQMEFKLLANQINPHFLYNTLETIRMLALDQGNQDVTHAIQLLAKSMRYTLESSGVNSTTLADSLEYTEIYLQIQQLRFGDRVNYSIQIGKGIDPQKVMVLPLLIQPVVENAIEHGLEGLNQTGYISILVQQVNSNILIIEVADNGVGIKADELETLKELINTSSRDALKNIGLRNVNSRIKMQYGKNSGLSIDSVYLSGTTVTLTLELPTTI